MGAPLLFHFFIKRLEQNSLQAFYKRFSGHQGAPVSDRQGADARRDATSGHFCLFMLPWDRRFGSGNPGSNPGGATHRLRSRRTRVRWDPLNPTRLVRGPSYDTKWQSRGVLGIGVLPARPKINRVS